MLASFTLENWMSFKDEASISMDATPERQHKEHLSRIEKYRLNLLPVASIYGGNASGKSNLFKALEFVKRFVVLGTQPEQRIPVERFRLNKGSMGSPASFRFELLIEERIYEFGFAVTATEVIEEWLVAISSANEKRLYHRKGERCEFHPSLQKEEFLHFAFQGTRKNQLFLTNAISQRVDRFMPVYRWFKESLHLISPEARFLSFEEFFEEGGALSDQACRLLSELDTGISKLGGEEVPLAALPLPQSIREEIEESVTEGVSERVVLPDGERYVFTREGDELKAKRLVTYHRGHDGNDHRFEMRNESDGSRRVIDLIPAFVDLCSCKSERVYVIDELDRSLHTLLTRRLIESYLSSRQSSSRAQLLFTTHDVLLMDQELLRRDEMWVAERANGGMSRLYAFSDFKDVRYDKDIRKSYLQGRLGGVPKLLLGAMTPQGTPD